MNLYSINKQVKARPMSFGEFYNYIHASPKEGFTRSNSDEGYLVEHAEANSNVQGHTGGLRWIPKDEFEYTHTAIPAHEEFTPQELRVVVELQQLEVKLKALVAFTKGDGFIRLRMRDRDLLLSQCRHMTAMVEILLERINRMQLYKRK